MTPFFAARRSDGERRGDGLVVARGAPGFEPRDLPGLGLLRYGEDRLGGVGERRRLGLDEAVDADDGLLAALDRLDPARIRFDELLFQVTGFHGGHGAAHLLDLRKLVLRRLFQLGDLGGDRRRAVEDVAVFQQVGLVGEDLLHAQRPLLVPRARQPERFVPGRQLHGARARALRQRDREHLEQNTG